MKNVYTLLGLGLITMSASVFSGPGEHGHGHGDDTDMPMNDASSHMMDQEEMEKHHREMMDAHHGGHEHKANKDKKYHDKQGNTPGKKQGHGHGMGQGMNGHHGMDGHHGMGHGASLAGRPGKESEVDRTIRVEADDRMRFKHEPLNIKDGETIKFIVTNKGKMRHEFSVGTKDEHIAHGKMMMENPNMHHGPGGPTIDLEPGETKSMIWHFEEAYQVEVACNVPGHYQAGMHSKVKFRE